MKSLLNRDIVSEVLADQDYLKYDQESLSQLMSESIYDLSDDKSIIQREEQEQIRLNEGCADVDDLQLLEEQARSYFRNPRRFPVRENKVKPTIVGYVQICDGVVFTAEGESLEKWSTIRKLQLSIGDILDPESIIRTVEVMRLSLNSTVRVVCYGNPLEELVGTEVYFKGQQKRLEPLSTEYEHILLAVPSYADISSRDESYYDAISLQISDEILYGSVLKIDRVTMGHIELTRSRLNELREESKEAAYLDLITRRERSFTQKRNQYDINFKEARLLIQKLNCEEILVGALFDKELKLINQILYLAEKQGERIENAFVYRQLKALAQKKGLDANKDLFESTRAFEIIEAINSGETIDLSSLTLEDLKAIFAILWSKTGLRIDSQYKEIYFQLKALYLASEQELEEAT